MKYEEERVDGVLVGVIVRPKAMKLTKFKPRDWVEMIGLSVCVLILFYIVGVAAYATVMS